MSGEEDSSFSFLPDEVIVHILEHLDIVSKRKARLTCLRWRVIMNTGDNWTLFGLLSDKVVLHILNLLSLPGKKITRLVCGRWRWLMDDPRLGCLIFQPIINNNASAGFLMNTCRNIETVRLENVTETLQVYSHKFPHIQNAIIMEDNAAVSIITFLRLSSEYLESLKFSFSSLDNVGLNAISNVFTEIHWNNLHQLELQVYSTGVLGREDENRYGVDHFIAVEELLKLATTPMIETLILDVTPLHFGPTFSLFSEMYGYIGRHTNTLKGLELNLFTRVEPELLVVSAQLQDSIRQNLKLDSLKIEFKCFTELRHVSILPCLLKSERLSTLTWESWLIIEQDQNDTTRFPAAKEQIQSLIERNETTLVDFNFISFKSPKDLLDVHLPQNYSNLKKLSLQNFQEYMNPEIYLPNIQYLEIREECSWPWIVNFDAWIVRNFINIETLRMYGYCTYRRNENIELSVLQKLLSLLKLKEIRYWLYYTGNVPYDEEIRQFCEITPTLNYELNDNKRIQYSEYGTDERIIKISEIFQL